DVQAIYKKDLPSVIYIEEQAKDGKGYFGSGFMAIKDGLAITAWHVVHNAKSVTARFSDGETYDVVGLIDHDPINDVALIKVKVTGRPLLTLQKDAPEIGSKACLIGAPLGADFTLSDGIISQIRHNPYQYQFTCPATHGNSGGPLLDEYGQVIGIDDSGVDQSTASLFFAVPIKYAMNLDETLPVKAWSDVKDDTPGDEASGDNISNDDLDKLMGAAYEDSEDASTYIMFIAQQIVQKSEYGMVSPDVYILQDHLKSDLEGLSSASSDDPLRERARKVLVDRDQHLSDALDDYTKAVLAAPLADAQTAHLVVDLLSRMMAADQAAPQLADDDLNALIASQAFMSGAPEYAARLHNKNPFKLGVAAMYRNSLLVCALIPQGLAQKMKIQIGDDIIAVDGQRPTDIVNACELAQKDAGKQVVITVQRGIKSIDLKGNVPASAALPPTPPAPTPAAPAH
ncbi:MAG TPA: trypsin-like peptidase domain-containing protein, partial [Capsulimonadaceae bacterium]|nr:trypsin-like peptidase domain-containing protein [Capsulimonadaceae bacterium]